MIFLIDYDRGTGRIVSMRTFEESSADSAAEARLQLEIDLNRRKIEREVVLLEAPSEEVLRRTHRRYFEDLPALMSRGNTPDSR